MNGVSYPHRHVWMHVERAPSWSVMFITRFTQATHWMYVCIILTLGDITWQKILGGGAFVEMLPCNYVNSYIL